VDVPLVIRRRLKELGLDQKDLAAAAEVTESYISQLLARKKGSSRAGPNRYLREDWKVPEARER
jgi:transcriptional regulator with XRE-family HTH domain